MSFHSHVLAGLINTGFGLSPSRTETFTRLVCGVLGTRTVNLAQIAAFEPGHAKVASSMRRNQRFFCAVRLSQQDSMKALVQMTGLKPPYQLCMDRTNWQFGKTDINYLVLCISTGTMRVPILWKLIDSKGCSNTQDRLAMIDTWIEALGASSIKVLLADREFVSNKYFSGLVARSVPFVIRVKDTHHVTLDDGRCMKLKTLTAKQQTRSQLARRKAKLRGMEGDLSLTFAAKKPRKGQMIVVACYGVKPTQALRLYKQRWRIETMFADWKTKGLNIEDTHLRCPEKLSLLLLVVAIASLWAQSLMQTASRKFRPQKASHGYLRQSWFRAGWDLLRQLARQNPNTLLDSWQRLWKRAETTNWLRVV